MSRAAELIRLARRESGLTQSALAQLTGIPQSVISAYEKGRREPSFGAVDQLISAAGLTVEISSRTGQEARMLSRVRSRAAELHAALEPLGARAIRVFGSVARGDDTSTSDVDLLVDLAPDVGLFNLLRMQGQAESILGRDVDLVPREGLKPDVAEAALREAILL
ncbi:helix-turn-helix domain-containing protein [Microbacterium sp. ARD32]|uniref:nucleotidyltransferase domain-containing protein n=1 Tax=Microbacterium sp. ARD32 TaxID=2962577 RepID=UPI002880FAF2|nr:nucleotidyltransferase domain-containing protein [Microbacterium sp. ARD32]MDT0156538.1 helix-turn-helix domain-containing protein [Microbacterium sp. ARD32]